MGDLQIGQTLKGDLYGYAIKKHISVGTYVGVLKVLGELGSVDSGISVEIAVDKKNRPHIDIINWGKTVFYVYYDSNEKSHIDIEPTSWVQLGQQQYRGGLKNGIPHGKGEMRWPDRHIVYRGNWHEGEMVGFGIMTWPSGKRYEGEWKEGCHEGKGMMFYPNGNIYEGEFHQNLRHGRGILRQPNGGYYEGEFFNDKPSGDCSFYDEKGRKYTMEKLHEKPAKSWMAKFWDKTWRLWAAIVCFALAVVFGMWVSDFFSGRGPSRMSAKGLLAPILMVVFGFKFLIGFFSIIFNNDK